MIFAASVPLFHPCSFPSSAHTEQQYTRSPLTLWWGYHPTWELIHHQGWQVPYQPSTKSAGNMENLDEHGEFWISYLKRDLNCTYWLVPQSDNSHCCLDSLWCLQQRTYYWWKYVLYYVWMYTYTYKRVHVYEYVDIYIYIYMYVCVSSVYIYIYCIYTQT